MESNSTNSSQAQLIISPDDLSQKLEKIRAFVFDWDGVFNDGAKGEEIHSIFSETDAMGVNMLRFGWYLNTGTMPQCAIITGANSLHAFQFANREHFHGIYYKFIDKKHALQHFCKTHEIFPEEVCFVYDDVLDLSTAALCGLKICINQPAAVSFKEYIIKNNLVDYITQYEGEKNAVREVSEYLLDQLGIYDRTIKGRVDFDEVYQKYWKERNEITTEKYKMEGLGKVLKE